MQLRFFHFCFHPTGLQVNINGEKRTANLGVFSRLWHRLNPTVSLQALVLSPGILLRYYRCYSGRQFYIIKITDEKGAGNYATL